MIEELVAECPDLSVVEYHFNDDYSNVYSDARVAYYDIVAFPNTHIDGFFQPNWSSYTAYVEAYDERIAVASNYSIDIELEGDGTAFWGSVDVSWLSAVNTHKVLHLVLTESHIPESWYGGEEIHYVARLMMPDQYGTPLISDKDTKGIIDFEFLLEEGWVKDYCELVAFVQDTVTMEVLQANSFLLSDVEIAYFDVALESIDQPGDEHCSEMLVPEITIKNLCNDFLTSFEISYEINGEPYTLSWTGNVFPNSTKVIELPDVQLTLLEENNIVVSLSNPNGENDQNPDNDMLEKSFDQAVQLEANQLVFELQTDGFGEETEWALTNETGEVVEQGGPYASNTYFTLTWDFMSGGCYTFAITDSGENGICCDNGSGYYRIKNMSGDILFEGGEFGVQESHLFGLDLATASWDIETGLGIQVYPNPASERIFISSHELLETVELYSYTGQLVIKSAMRKNFLSLDVLELEAGLYLLRVKTSAEISTRTLIIK